MTIFESTNDGLHKVSYCTLTKTPRAYALNFSGKWVHADINHRVYQILLLRIMKGLENKSYSSEAINEKTTHSPQDKALRRLKRLTGFVNSLKAQQTEFEKSYEDDSDEENNSVTNGYFPANPSYDEVSNYDHRKYLIDRATESILKTISEMDYSVAT